MNTKNIVLHPSAFVKAEDVQVIRNAASEAEQTGMLHPEQLAIIYKQNWFKLLVPRVYAGQQVALPGLLRQQEAISWADGSTGWVVTLCNGAGWFGGFLAPETARQVFGNSSVCLAGSGAAAGTADITPNGYIINGTWKYGSGVHHATHITANCIIRENGEPVLNSDGQPLVLPFIFDKKDVSILPAWKYIGMIATGSDTFEVKNLQVAPGRQFKIDPSAAIISEPIYLYPFLQLAETTIAVNLSGIAIHFIDLCEGIFHEKLQQPRLTAQQKAFLTDELNRAKSDMDTIRTNFYETVTQSWNTIQISNAVPADELKQVSIASYKLAKVSREVVDRLYPLCGLAAANTDTEINRAWRDLHTASQHSVLTFAISER
jgi:indole-3-acetate monooxygenase